MRAFVILALMGISMPVMAEEPPLFQADPGAHTGAVLGLATDGKGWGVASGGADKAVRLWSGLSDQLDRTLWPYEEPGDEGRVRAVALSPDERTLAVGGSMGLRGGGARVYLFDRRSGRQLRRLGDEASPAVPGGQAVVRLAFSRDGAQLLVGLRRGGVRLHRVSDGAELARDEGYEGPCVAADFGPLGALVTSDGGGALRVYDASLRLRRRGASPLGAAHGARFSPDGAQIAVGHRGRAAVALLSPRDLSLLAAPDSAGLDGDLRAVAFDVDGALYAGGARGRGGARIRRWGSGGRGAAQDFPVAAPELAELAPLPRGVAFSTGASGAVGVLGRVPLRVRMLGPAPPTALGPALRVDSNGARVLLTLGGAPMLFSLPERSLRKSEAPDDALQAPRPLALAPALPGAAAQRCAAAGPAGAAYVGTDEGLHGFSEGGRQRFFTATPAPVLGVNGSGDGRLVVAVLADATVRWYGAEDGRPLLSLFAAGGGQRWITWTPSGYYDSSVEGEGLLGWRVPRGPDFPEDFVRVARLRQRLYRPDVVGRVLYSRDEARTVDETNVEAGRPAQTEPLRNLLPPVLTILDPPPGKSVDTTEVTLRVAVRSPSGEPVNLRAVVRSLDGASRGLDVVSGTAAPRSAGADEVEQRLVVTIPPEPCEITVIGETSRSRSEPARVALQYKGQPRVRPRPNLYVLAIGVSEYQDRTLRLEYASKDAADLGRALLEQQGKAYRSVKVLPITDDKATRAGILDGFRWLREQVRQDDTAVIFLAGHGTNGRDGRYYFVPYEGRRGQTATLLAGEEVQKALGSLMGHVVIFLDTCHAGSIQLTDLNRLTNELISLESVVVFAASTGSQLSQESNRWKNGVFTKAVVEGLRGKADYRQDGNIMVSNLETYVSARVRELTGEAQTPATAKPKSVTDLLMAQVPLPIHKRWWFWGGLGLVAAGAVAGVLASKPWEPQPAVLVFERSP